MLLRGFFQLRPQDDGDQRPDCDPHPAGEGQANLGEEGDLAGQRRYDQVLESKHIPRRELVLGCCSLHFRLPML